MSEFIVLGLIPGTHTELTFTFWLTIASLLFGGAMLWKIWHSSHVRMALITLRVVLALRQPLRISLSY